MLDKGKYLKISNTPIYFCAIYIKRSKSFERKILKNNLFRGIYYQCNSISKKMSHMKRHLMVSQQAPLGGTKTDKRKTNCTCPRREDMA